MCPSGVIFKKHCKARVRRARCVDSSHMKPVKAHIQQEEAIWKGNHLPAVDLNQRQDIFRPTEINMQSLKGKR